VGGARVRQTPCHRSASLRGSAPNGCSCRRTSAPLQSPWSLWWYAIAPGTLFVRYLTYFFDTNPLLVTALVVCYIGSDLSFWLDVVALIDPSTRNPALRAFLIRGLFSLLSGLLVFAAYLLLPLVLTVGVWTVLADFAFDVYASEWRELLPGEEGELASSGCAREPTRGPRLRWL